MSKKAKEKEVEEKNTLSFGKYSVMFRPLKMGKTDILKDEKSEKRSSMPVKATDTGIYVTEPDGKLIPAISGQGKCDYLIYCQRQPQACYIELKGKNIAGDKKYNPYDQIRETLVYLRKQPEFREMCSSKTEQHAFIVSPEQQKLPKYSGNRDHALLQELIKNSPRPSGKVSIADYIHYVRVMPSDRYSDKKGTIICSPKHPVPVPYKRER